MRPPQYPRKGKAVEDTVREIIDYVKATTIKSFQGGKIKESRNGTTLSIPSEKADRFIRPRPFELTLSKGDSGYYITVDQGYVVERALSATSSENSLILHECDNRLNLDSDPTRFAISSGEAIFVQVLEDEFGRVKGGTDVVLVVDDAAEESRNFVPGGGDGVTLYKLGELETNGSSVRLVNVLSGSHIYHSTGLTADFRIVDCPAEPESTPTQYVRLSFVSGKLHSMGESVEARPLAETVQEIGLDGICT